MYVRMCEGGSVNHEVGVDVFLFVNVSMFSRIEVSVSSIVLWLHELLQNKAGQTALHIACEKGHASVVRYLMNAGVDKSTIDKVSSVSVFTPFVRQSRFIYALMPSCALMC